MAAEKEWSENPEDDPIELQKRQLELGKRFIEKMEKAEAEEKRRREEYEAAPPIGAQVYTPPSFEEVSAVLQKCWVEVDRIMPGAGEHAKAIAFQAMIQAAGARRGPFGG